MDYRQSLVFGLFDLPVSALTFYYYGQFMEHDPHQNIATMSERVIKVGSRKSELAMKQTNSVIEKLNQLHKDIKFEIVSMTTIGDNILDTALSKIGEKNLFTRELETALLNKEVSFVVHSLKDLPTVLPQGLIIGAVCSRDDPRDAVVMRSDSTVKTLEELPKDSVIGTSSLRRAAQLRKKFPNLKLADVRGNLNTRMRKLDDESRSYSALILAVAGLERMNWSDRISQILEPEECMYAVGQGALAVECRDDDTGTLDLLSALSHENTTIQCVAERAFLRRLEGGCSVPVAVYTEIQDNTLTLHGGVFSIDGTEAVTDKLSDNLDHDLNKDVQQEDANQNSQAAAIALKSIKSSGKLLVAEKLGTRLANELIKAGADKILEVAKKQTADAIRKRQAEKSEANENNGDSLSDIPTKVKKVDE